MNIIKLIGKMAALSAVAFSFLACEHDPESLGSNIIGEPGFNADLYDEAQISATSVNLPPVQTNNVSTHLFGVYNDQVYGEQVASILTQLSLSSANPTFGEEAVVDSVVLKIPYFSTELEPGENGDRVYELDSVIGEDPIKFSVLESGLYLNQFDPETNFEKAQKYYSDMQMQIENNLTGNVLYESQNFVPSAEEIVDYGLNEQGEEDTLYSAPALRIKLAKEFFQEKIIDREGMPELANNNDFRNYLRGIYLKAESLNTGGNMSLLNLSASDAGITIYYTALGTDVHDRDDDDDTSEQIPTPRSFELSFEAESLNTFEQEVPDFTEENIYLKGGEGSMAVIELFSGSDSDGDGISDELEFLRDSGWLINEANLVFHVNRDFMAESPEPKQLYLYDLKNNNILADYVLENPGQMNQPASRANEGHLGVLQRDGDGNGLSYKIRLTAHVNALLNKDSTNARLGLVVSQNVNLLANSALKGNTPVTGLDRVPASSVISPLGTVLYGPDAAEEEKRLKLNIYYTEPKE